VNNKEILFCDIDLEDLQEVAALESRMAISKGELSTIAFANGQVKVFCQMIGKLRFSHSRFWKQSQSRTSRIFVDGCA
jgi:hypothetical protein